MANEMSSCSPVSRPEMQKRDSVGSDAFSKRDYWHEAASRSFTRVRCMSTAGCVASQVYRDLTTPVKKTNSAPPFVLHENSTTGKSGDDGEERALPNGTHILAELNLQFEEDGMLTYDEDSPECSSTCSACGRTFEALDLVVVFESDVYHTVCFRCGQCRAIVDASRLFLVLDDGSPLCLECSPSCHMCKGKITSNHVGVLNKDFHEGCLKCSQCEKGFSTISKVYASSGEPCCAECITPVFDETWSPRSPSWCMPPLPDISESQITDKKSGSFSTSVGSPRTPHTLPPKLETLSQAVSDLPSLGKYPSLLRPSMSAPVLSNGQTTNSQMQKLSLSSLEAILYDELGVSLFMNFCVEDCSIEMVVFWLDVEHFKHFDGDMDDMRLFAHHIMLKYIGYYAELPLGLPKSVEDQIIQDMQKENLSQDMFNVAQEHVYDKMEQNVQPRFLKSQDGRNYLEALVTRDIDRRQKKREATIQAMSHVKATVTNFDKRHLNTKFYIYEIMVEMEDSKFMIYRRYSDFHTLHHDLRTFCPSELFPPMPKKIYFGRSQTRTVAQQRMKELEGYLQGVLAMPPAVSRGPILMQFLAQTPVDKEDEAFTMRIMESQRVEGQF